MRRAERTERKVKHFTNLAAILGLTPDGVAHIWRHLKRIETDGRKIAERYCNGELDTEQVEVLEAKLRRNLEVTLKYAKQSAVREIKFNWDPRGHFLKFDDEWVRAGRVEIETDWGGYGILVPEGI